ncbi:MAG TPA: hypothetical protein VJ725_21260 [Thermoanaerobaculia bacterium]|nr:hypothetical protein [Thermoanaerobaculia bacterium]
MRRTELADLARALEALGPEDEETRSRIAALLGFVPPPPPPPPAPPKPDRIVRVEDEGRGKDDDVEVAERSPSPSPPRATPQPATETGTRELAATLTPIYEKSRPPGWLEEVDLLEEPGPAVAPPEPDPLLVPGWTRSVLSGALATLASQGPLDVERLVRAVARAAPVLRVPRRPWPTLARGVQVLVDRSESMAPFARDQTWLVAQIRAVAGRETTQVLYFDGLPAWGAGPGSRRLWREYLPWHTPPAGTAVLLVSDLGLGAPLLGARTAGVASWQQFAEDLARAGCPAVAFVPYGPRRWPRELRRAFHLLHWDPKTSVHAVRREIGRGLRAPGGEPR